MADQDPIRRTGDAIWRSNVQKFSKLISNLIQEGFGVSDHEKSEDKIVKFNIVDYDPIRHTRFSKIQQIVLFSLFLFRKTAVFIINGFSYE